ncbi:translation initiation factor IF-3 [candidate division GN15 bacterium]|nr:translation initiation factor IF-3 [candidate division GN15 bacterium]
MAKQDVRVNDRIRISPVRLIGVDGEQIGIIPTNEALQRAREQGLDLVEVAPNSRPPVCRIMDYGKYKYELSKKDRAAKKKQQSVQLKEMRYRPKIDEHDYSFKTKHVRSFLEGGNKVKAFVMFRGREMAHVDFGRQILTRLADEMSDIASVDVQPSLEGNRMTMILSPKSDIVKKAQEKSKSKKSEKKQEQDGSDNNE